jgi:hypothetical protein
MMNEAETYDEDEKIIALGLMKCGASRGARIDEADHFQRSMCVTGNERNVEYQRYTQSSCVQDSLLYDA